MGKTIGGTRVGPINLDILPTGIRPPTNLQSLSQIPDRRTRLDVQQGISRFEAVYGLRTTNVKIGTVDAYGVAFISGPDEGLVVLSKRLHSDAPKLIEKKLREYQSGFKVKTNAPLKHTVIHELGHQTWNTVKERRGGKWGNAGVELRKLYSQYRKETLSGKKPFSMYGTTNIDEFYAEAIAGSIIGTKQTQRNKFIKGVRRITKKFKL